MEIQSLISITKNLFFDSPTFPLFYLFIYVFVCLFVAYFSLSLYSCYFFF